MQQPDTGEAIGDLAEMIQDVISNEPIEADTRVPERTRAVAAAVQSVVSARVFLILLVLLLVASVGALAASVIVAAREAK